MTITQEASIICPRKCGCKIRRENYCIRMYLSSIWHEAWLLYVCGPIHFKWFGVNYFWIFEIDSKFNLTKTCKIHIAYYFSNLHVGMVHYEITPFVWPKWNYLIWLLILIIRMCFSGMWFGMSPSTDTKKDTCLI